MRGSGFLLLCCRLALARPAPPPQEPQQALGHPEVAPRPSQTPPSAAARITTNQPQQDLIVIDDSPQLPNAHPQPQHLPDALWDEGADADDVAAATQPGKRQRRQLLDSSSDSDGEAAPFKAARTASGTGARQANDQPDQGQADEDSNRIGGHHPIGRMDSEPAHDIIPDSSIDGAGMPEPCEDYGNEPVFEEDYEEDCKHCSDEASPHDAAVGVEDDTDWAGEEPLHASRHLASPAAARAAVDSPTKRQHCNQPMEIVDNPDPRLASDEAAGDNMPDRSSDVITATEALFNPPFTTLSNIAEYAPQMPACDFPMTLRIDGTLGNPLCMLLFKDNQGRALEEYSIDMELCDTTSKCTATVGHDILLQAVGELSTCRHV